MKGKTKQTETPRNDIYDTITARLVAAVEADPGQPVMPWRRRSGPLFVPVNAVTKRPYNGINIVALWVAARGTWVRVPVVGHLQAMAGSRRAGHRRLKRRVCCLLQDL